MTVSTMVRGAAMALAMTMGLSAPALAQPGQLTSAGRPDYDQPANWLCRPDLKDNRCHVDLDATVIAPSGAMSLEKYVPAKAPKIDCFFVYPTVSKDPGWQSDLTPDRMEWDDIRVQFARFEDAPQDARFATAVAGFAELLRGGRYNGALSYDDVLRMASGAKGNDEFGYRTEFIQLVRTARIANGIAATGQ